MLNFRSKPGSFPQACRGTSMETDAAGSEKAVKDALQQVSRYALIFLTQVVTLIVAM
ncbi:hypothetical protein HUB98_27450 [Paenibacillus barcinonensis]|uniref:Uncharacterized protein n=1 Tax=Paenibacillus barcinonensis TaxID=198119 RepID=A0ABX6QC75_PAEBA|nr:hypothetical protein [Paenibacillus barcinonensis]QKS59572.1 hypothetical protein HUB98_27450 [Paenibacillus barcinonensis]